MRWSIIRTIWLRELRDQLRDRRTIFMIVALPLLLYPVLGVVVLQLVVAFGSTPSTIGIVTGVKDIKDFPPRDPPGVGRSPLPALAWFAATPLAGTDITQWTGAAALAQADHLAFDYPFLIQDGRFTTFDRTKSRRQSHAAMDHILIKLVFLDSADEKALEDHKLDLVITIPADFFAQLDAGDDFAADHPLVELLGRKGDNRTRVAKGRVMPLLDLWRHDLKKTRLARKGISENFLEPFTVKQPETSEGGAGVGNIADLAIRIFPFMLVMWSLAGALYPAVDLCAGEKERGTMETLLITPAGREEIVLGKFLTIWVFSSATALLNLFSMGFATELFSAYRPQGGIAIPAVSIPAMLWCTVLLLPQSAFFSAISLAIGAYARSSKEGQYYLMPLFLLTMPLIFLTLVPGIELNALYSMVPVTGVALLMQRLMSAPTLGDIPWVYFIPVLAPMALYSWLALRWAIEQFNREDVLFREAERIDVLLWLKSLLRDKSPLPTTGEAFFCLGMLIGLRWLSMGLGGSVSVVMHSAISQLAFVAMPPIFMVLLLNTQPGEALFLRRPNLREAGLAALLALLLLPPMAGLAQAAATWYPRLLESDGKHPLIGILKAINEGSELSPSRLLTYLLAFAVIPAICEEVAFRGYVLRGLHVHFRPRNAVLLGAFFFALFHMNVFLFVPTFVFGVVLGLLTVRTRSLLPAILFHLLHNSVLIALIPLRQMSGDSWFLHPVWLTVIATCLVATIAIVWRLYRKPYVDLARQQADDQQTRSHLPIG